MSLTSKKKFSGYLIAVLACAPYLANASCNELPEPPTILEKSHLLYSELDVAKTSIDAFVDQIAAYQDCLNRQITALNIDFDTPDMSPDIIAEFSRIQSLSDLLYQNQKIAVERYNQLLNGVEHSNLED